MKGKTVISFMLIIMVCLFALGCSSKTEKVANAKDIRRYSVETLLRDYRDNEASADQKYKNKIFEVAGLVDSVRKRGGNYEVTISKDGNSIISSVACDFDEPKGVSSLRQGDSVIIRGIGNGKNILPQLEYCILIK